MPLADPEILANVERLAALRGAALLDSPAEEAFDRWTRLTAQLLGAPTALISLVDDHRQFFKSAYGLGEPWSSKRETPLTHSFCQHAVASGQPLIVNDAVNHPLVHDNLAIRDLGVQSYLGAPLTTEDGQTLGVLCAVDGKARAWTPQQLATLEALSKSVMNEMALRATIKELGESEARSLRQSLLLRSVVDQMDDVLIAVDLLDQPILANEKALALREANARNRLRLLTAEGKPMPWTERPMARALRGEAIRDARLRWEMEGEKPRWMSVNARPLRDEQGKQVGALSEARDLTTLIAAQDELKYLNERLREQSFADELTGLYNRRGFVALAQQELKVALRARRKAIVFYADLDGMKEINDRLGHETGDAALLEAAAVLRSTFRDSDVPARMGGDEFAIFVNEANDANARLIVARLQENVAEANREHRRPFRLAMSCGWAVFDPAEPLPLDELIARADAAMYEDKRRRRANRGSQPPQPSR